MSDLTRDLNLARRSMGYLSAAMSAPTALRRSALRAMAIAVSHELWEHEVLHYCPHANSPAIGLTDVDYEKWMAMDIEVIRRCDWILMLGEWGTSYGCRREFNVAQALKIPVAYSISEAIQLSREADIRLNAA